MQDSIMNTIKIFIFKLYLNEFICHSRHGVMGGGGEPSEMSFANAELEATQLSNSNVIIHPCK